MKYKLSKQAAASIMMAVNRAIYNTMRGCTHPDEIDVTKTLLSFELEQTIEGLSVLNPPVMYIPNEDQEDNGVQ